jgi:transcriptional regulator with XRE-family HTH domain
MHGQFAKNLAASVNLRAPERNREAMDDDELIAAVTDGDDSALRELFSRHAPWLARPAAYPGAQPATSQGRRQPVPDETTLGQRIQAVRKRRGLTQNELARAAGVSESLVKKLEQGEINDTRLETAHKIAAALGVPTSTLMPQGDAPVPAPESRVAWQPVRRALEGAPDPELPGEPTLEGVRSTFRGVLPLLLGSRFAELGAVLPALLRDSDALVAGSVNATLASARVLRAQIRQVAGALMLHTWQFETADQAFDLAMSDADDPLIAMSVVEERCWGLIRQGKLAETWELAFRWVDDHEPRMSAGRNELAAWGRLLIRASAAAVRDNQPGQARDALRLARMAAAGTDRDFTVPYAPWHVFGPVTVQVAAAENAAIQDNPQATLDIAGRLAKTRLPVRRYAPSHRLDVAQAHVTLRQYPEAVSVLVQLRQERPEWLPRQRHASDILGRVIQRRRTLTPEMRDLASFIGLPC